MANTSFITEIAPYVQKYCKQYGYKYASAIIAQAINESGWGESTLASKYHNYFGLKCGSGWSGKSVNMTTKEEYSAGTLTTITDNFRVYDNMDSGVKGYFDFISGYSRYSNLKNATSPKDYLEKIKSDGYATSSSYVTNVYALVTQYNLTSYDDLDSTSTSTSETVLSKAYLNTLVNDVIAGKYGNGETRKTKLGNLYDVVQSMVNEKLGVTPKEDYITILANMVIRGDFGNGEDRKNALTDLYDEVQKKVNSILS